MKFCIIVNRENYYIKVCWGGGDVKSRRHFYRGSLKNRRLMTKGGGGQKSQKIDDVFYERPPIENIAYIIHTLYRCRTFQALIQAFQNYQNSYFVQILKFIFPTVLDTSTMVVSMIQSWVSEDEPPIFYTCCTLFRVCRSPPTFFVSTV